MASAGVLQSEGLAGAGVEGCRDGCEVPDRVPRQVGALREVLPQQAVGRSYVCQAAWARPLNAAAGWVAAWMRR